MRQSEILADKNQTITRMVSPIISKGTPSNTPCLPEVAKAIENLRAQLQRYYGENYAFTVIGEGHVLAASNFKHGRIFASTL